MIPKRKSHAFGKDIYLLGKFKSGEFFWLEKASWDCDWYWGFGYIETYTNNENPNYARDISSHSHWDSLVGKQEVYDHEKQTFKLGNYVHHLNAHPNVEETVLTDKESWELAELMATFYRLKQTTEVFGRGGSHLVSLEKEREIVTRKEWANEINTVILPKLFEEIYHILEPS